MTLTLSARLYLFIIALFLAGFFFGAMGATSAEIFAAESVYVVGASGILLMRSLRQRWSRSAK